MTLYAYKAMGADGRIVLGRMDATNAIDLELRLKRMDLDYIRGNPVRQIGMFGGRAASRRELINFCFHLEQLSRAGVPILEGLTDLRDSLENPRFREVIAGMIESIDGGKTLSQAMAEHPSVFDDVFVSLIAAGEHTGKLQEVLGNLVESLKWQDELAAQTKKLIMYPAFMGTVVIGVILFMMIYLVPKMVGFITNMGHELPLHTKLLIGTSNVFVNHWYLVIGLPLALVAVAVAMVRTHPAARLRFDSTKLRLPLVGVLLRKVILSRFASVFAMMYGSGISILDSLRASEGVVGNQAIRNGLRQVGEMIAEGQSITTAFQNVGLFPPLVIRMLKVGENTGALDTALVNVGYFYGRDVRESLGRIQALIEPVMTIVLGLMLGWVMLSVLGPVYDTITKLKM
ncbi:MAG: type II secretion system F family protein [Rhodocyclaceae bacterium]|nr:type II secretion system F family protein [Rhodocyclaceae bacterium]MBK6555328.1 type II secretion system F family protein [Rhodocyclaceae bacterium]MBK9309389.1 type II secretion system F family protein [Rhodocyclaceae bacterium]